MSARRTDIVIVGGTTGGVAAALAALEHGADVIVIESTDWIGGQLTAQGVPPDENEWIETGGGTLSYREFRRRVRSWYHQRPLTPEARADDRLNPGGGWVSRLCFEPSIGHDVLLAMLNLHRDRLEILLEHDFVGVECDGDAIRAVEAVSRETGERVTIEADYVLDATDLGDVLPACGEDFAIGSESQAAYGELHAPSKPDIRDQQAVSWCFAMEHRPDDPQAIDRPPDYDFWVRHHPQTIPPWPGPLFSWTIPTHNEEGVRVLRMIPDADHKTSKEWELWRYRRIRQRSIYTDAGAAFTDVCLVNWVQMDHWLRPSIDDDGSTNHSVLADARRQSLCLMYWMQHDAPRHDDKGTGYPGLRFHGESLGTSDGFAKAPYIREPRRMLAEFMVTEEHVGTEQRTRDKRQGQDLTKYGSGEPFPDSIGIGHYPIDLHPSASGRGSVYVPATPFRIPLGSIIPRKTTNLLAAGKCLGVSHIANGCFRLHPVEWNIGESAGLLAAWCLAEKTRPSAVLGDANRLASFQGALVARGVLLGWPWEDA